MSNEQCFINIVDITMLTFVVLTQSIYVVQFRINKVANCAPLTLFTSFLKSSTSQCCTILNQHRLTSRRHCLPMITLVTSFAAYFMESSYQIKIKNVHLKVLVYIVNLLEISLFLVLK